MNNKTSNIKLLNLHDYRLLVFDMDGTILNSSHLLTDQTRDVLLKLHDEKINFTLATGRNLPACQEIAEALDIRLPLILNNGSVLQMRTGEIIAEWTLPIHITRTVIDICDMGGRDLVIATADTNYIKKLTQFHHLMLEYGSSGMTAVGNWESLDGVLSHVNKCVVVDRESHQNLIDLEKQYREKLGDQVDYVYTLIEMLEVLPKGVNKASALRTLVDSLKIDITEVMAFGDGNNDVEMLNEAGLGVVVANASDRAMRSADVAIPSNEDDGVAQFLQQLFEAET